MLCEFFLTEINLGIDISVVSRHCIGLPDFLSHGGVKHVKVSRNRKNVLNWNWSNINNLCWNVLYNFVRSSNSVLSSGWNSWSSLLKTDDIFNQWRLERGLTFNPRVSESVSPGRSWLWAMTTSARLRFLACLLTCCLSQPWCGRLRK